MVAGLFATCLLSLFLPVIVLAGPHASPHINRHHGLARRAEGNVELFRRGGDRFSFYNAETGNAGSCGTVLFNSGFTVAMNVDQMQSSWCFKTITVSYNGQSTTATIVDTCPGCPYGGLDMTPGLFSFFAPQSVGIIYGNWEFTGAPAPPKPSPPPPPPPPPPPSPTPSPTPPPPPPPPKISLPPVPISLWSSSTSQSITPTSTHSGVSSSNTHNSTLNSSSAATPSATSIDLSSGAASGLAEPTGTVVVTPGAVDNIQDLFQAFIELAALVKVAHEN